MDRIKNTGSIKASVRPAGVKRKNLTAEERRLALRTAFIARFIVLREGRRSKAHRMIEEMVWTSEASAEEVSNMFRQAFLANGDKMRMVEKDISKAMKHAERSAEYFAHQYISRATSSFIEALEDYVRSNTMLFEADDPERPRASGWKVEDLDILKSL